MTADPLLQALIAGFSTEAEDLARQATKDILALERDPGDPQALKASCDRLARALHTLKGSAATIGLDELAELAHGMEDLVAPVRKVPAALGSARADALLAALDGFLSRTRAHASGAELQDLGPAFRRLQAAAEASQLEAAPAPARERPAEAGPAAPAQEVRPEQATDLAPAEAKESLEGWRVQASQIDSLLRDVERIREHALSIGERRLELQRAVREIAALAGAGPLAESLASIGEAIKLDAEVASDVVDSLEESVRAMCTLPARVVLEPLQRAVRDLCRQLGKEANLSFVGAEVALDRRLLEGLKGPLVQLVRNAVDHGLEAPDDRERAGKHREGALAIRVEHVGNVAFVEVSDDGRGLDLEAIRAEAVARGLVGTEEAARMAPQQVQQLVFRSGFSTRREVTGTSGRGVGLDVVRSQLEQRRGRVEVQSVAGQGTRFVLSLPAQLGSSPLLLVRIAGHEVAVPALSVEAVVSAAPERLRESAGKLQLAHGEEVLSLADLGERLGLRQAAAPAPDRPVLVLRAQGRAAAVVVDQVLGEHDLVVRPLPPEVAEVAAFQGAATASRGELVLVLRSDWLVARDDAAGHALRGARLALVVDDSLTARALHRTVLEAGGFDVHLAEDAHRALEQLGRARYDVMVCDIGMEGMDGLELTARVRAAQSTRALPIVLVSALDGPGDRERGYGAGADAYISKRECASGRLLAAVSEAMAARSGGGVA